MFGDAPRVLMPYLFSQMPPGWFHARLLLMCGVGFTANSMAVSLLSFVSVCASVDWGLSDSENASLIRCETNPCHLYLRHALALSLFQ